MENSMMYDLVKTKYRPIIPNLTFRNFVGEDDYLRILTIIEGCKEIDGIKRTDTLDDIRSNYEHLVNCDPYKDVTFVEINGKPVGYSRVFWDRLDEGIRTYTSFGFLLPEWRRKGIGKAMLMHNEDRLIQISADHPPEEARFFQSWAADTEKNTQALLESQGYSPLRYEFDLVRDLRDPIPTIPLPVGLDIRPVQEEHIRAVIQAADEAFQDHWGYRPIHEEEIEGWKESPDFRPELWKVAWDGDQIAGSVQNFYKPHENEEYMRKRGYTEGISTRRPWRRRGLASALIAESMRMFAEMGMTETAHGVDAENTSGALKLYKQLGYKVVKQSTTFRKPMDI
jgi:ribosomal protein S18 acetylase RimI-like enzyme